MCLPNRSPVAQRGPEEGHLNAATLARQDSDNTAKRPASCSSWWRQAVTETSWHFATPAKAAWGMAQRSYCYPCASAPTAAVL